MQYEFMYPDQIRSAIKEKWSLVLPLGVLEYHAEHCVLGVDTLLVQRAIEIIEKEMNLIILPPFYYGAASYSVEPPENNGTIQIESSVINSFGRELFKSLLRVGFRKIFVFFHHQSENFIAGMPTDLAFKLAARQATFEFLDKKYGEGWWGNNKMGAYYKKHEEGTDPFNWIQIYPFMSAEAQKKFPVDHAGLQESSLMMAFCPEGIDMGRLSEKKWYMKESKKATIKYGNKAKDVILNDLREILK